MAEDFGAIEGMITIPSSAQYLTCTDDSGGPTAVTLTAGDYYWHTSEGSGTLKATLQSDINGVMGETWTVAISAGAIDHTGKMTLSCTGATCTVTWNDNDFRELCGYTSNLSGSTSYTSTYQVRMFWLPDGPRVSKYGTDSGQIEDNITFSESPDGVVKRLYYSTKTSYEGIEYHGISREYARIKTQAASTDDRSYEAFWQQAIRGDNPFAAGDCKIRLYDAAMAAAGEYNVSGDHTGPQMRQLSPGWIEQWIISMPRLVED